MSISDLRDHGASDIVAGNWIDRHVPAPVRPYLRLARIDRPIGIWLLMLPCWWGAALAAPGWPNVVHLLLFALGATLMRGAGCTLNDIVDRKFDSKVARTASRPLPSGAVSVRQAIVFMVALCVAAFFILLQFNLFTIVLASVSLLLVAIYPFAKRVTNWPQAVLGLTFNWGALVGWSAQRGELDWPAIALYLAGLFWTLGYDTIYAHQDKEDDLIVGVKSTALALGKATRPWLVGFYTASGALLLLAGWLASLSIAFYGAMAAVLAHLAWQVARVDLDNPKDCLAVFKANQTTGLLVFVAIVLGQVLG